MTVAMRFGANSSNALRAGPGPFIERTAQAFQALTPAVMPSGWADREDRMASLEEHVRQGIAWHVRVNREERGLNQNDLAKLMGTGQSAISKLEDPDGGDVRLSTLFKAAHAFDCALQVHFVSYSQFAGTIADVRSERMFACPYEEDVSPHKALTGGGVS